MKKQFIEIEKESLEVLILNYIFSNLEKGKNRIRYAGEGFCRINKNSSNGINATIEYKVFTEYSFEDGDKEEYNDVVQITLESNCDYSKEDMNTIKEDMYLDTINDVAFIINIVKSSRN